MSGTHRRVPPWGAAMTTTYSKFVALFATLAIAPPLARPAEDLTAEVQLAQAEPQPVQPSSPAPAEPPPPPPGEDPALSTGQMQAPAQQATPAGQWVYTQQYGWVWMPYGSAYTYLPSDGGAPAMYIYYPLVGWSWVIAPWVWGWGPMPYFGYYGPWRFAWYGHGYGHWYGYRGVYAGWYGRGYWHGGAWHGYRAGARPAPPPGPRVGRVGYGHAPPPRGGSPGHWAGHPGGGQGYGYGGGHGGGGHGGGGHGGGGHGGGRGGGHR